MSRLVDQVGRVLGGRYRLLAPLGTGASGHVFVAEDVTLRRRVAVKVLHEALANDEPFLRRFQAEARAVAALNHPNVMAVYDWGEDASGPFLVTEVLEGGSLRSLLDRGYRLSPSQALLLGLHVSQGLEYAHRRGLVHRDIKPANLLFDAEGRVRIADFGIARALAEAAWTEPLGAVIGSARYASPEQAQGSTLDGRSDLYSLALVLVEAVTGDVPFAADTTIATLMGRVGKSIPVPDVLDALAPAVEAAGAADPADRPDATAFAAMLDETARRLPRPKPLPVGEAVVGSAATSDPDPTMVGQLPVAAAAPSAGAPSPAPGSSPPVDMGATTTMAMPPPAAAPMVPPLDPPTVVTPPRRRRRWPWVALASVLFVLAAAVGIVESEVLVPSHKVPRVLNVGLAEARQRLDRLGYDVVVTSRRYQNDTTVDQVLQQDPQFGESLKEGHTVGLVVSLGPTPQRIPDDLEGATRESAITRLRDLGFNVVESGRRDENVPKGRVLEVSGAGTERPRGSEIDLVVSEGPPLRRIPPGLVGEDFATVEAQLRSLGLKVERVEGFSDDVDTGQVFGVSPASGESAERDSTVKVSVSKGAKTIPIPTVRGRRAEEAVRILEGAGFSVKEIRGPFRGRVQSTDPPEGSKHERGTSVTVFMG